MYSGEIIFGSLKRYQLFIQLRCAYGKNESKLMEKIPKTHFIMWLLDF